MNSSRQETNYREQPILTYAERAVDAQMAADQAERDLVHAALTFREKSTAARAAAYTYAEILEARLKVRDLPPAA